MRRKKFLGVLINTLSRFQFVLSWSEPAINPAHLLSPSTYSFLPWIPKDHHLSQTGVISQPWRGFDSLTHDPITTPRVAYADFRRRRLWGPFVVGYLRHLLSPEQQKFRKVDTTPRIWTSRLSFPLLSHTGTERNTTRSWLPQAWWLEAFKFTSSFQWETVLARYQNSTVLMFLLILRNISSTAASPIYVRFWLQTRTTSIVPGKQSFSSRFICTTS